MIAIVLAAAATSISAQLPCEPASLDAPAKAPRMLLACQASPDLYLLDSGTGRVVARVLLAGPTGVRRINAALAPDGHSAAASWQDGTIAIWHEQQPNRPVQWKAPFYANSLSFTPDSRRLLVDGVVHDAVTGKAQKTSFAGSFDAPNDIAYDSNGRTAFVAEADTTIRTFDLATGREEARDDESLIEPRVIATDPASGNVVAGMADGTLRLLSPQLRLLRQLRGPAGTMIVAMAVLKGRALVATAPQNGGSGAKAFVVDFDSGRWTATAVDHLIAVRYAGGFNGYWVNGRTLTIKKLELLP